MAKKTVSMQFDAQFDDERTDAESLASALDRLLTTAMSSPGILEEYGDVTVLEIEPVEYSNTED